MLTVRGYNFPKSMQCRFGDPSSYAVTVNATWISNSTLRCRAPRWEAPQGPSQVPLVVLIAVPGEPAEPVIYGPALTFEYTSSCAADACGSSQGRGFCITGICSCVPTWSGSNCSQELFPPSIDQVARFNATEGAPFSATLTAPRLP